MRHKTKDTWLFDFSSAWDPAKKHNMQSFHQTKRYMSPVKFLGCGWNRDMFRRAFFSEGTCSWSCSTSAARAGCWIGNLRSCNKIFCKIAIIYIYIYLYIYMGVSENRGTPKSSILVGFSIINHQFWGIFWKHPYIYILYLLLWYDMIL